MSIAEEIKHNVSMKEIAEFYGFEATRGGFIRCPFHKEKTPSLKLYTEPGRGWNCYGCGHGGSVIDFVMELFGISFRQAVLRINHDLGLGLASERPDSRKRSKAARERAERIKNNTAMLIQYETKTALFRCFWLAQKNLAPHSPDEPWHPLYVEACHQLPVLEQWFDENPYDRRWEY